MATPSVDGISLLIVQFKSVGDFGSGRWCVSVSVRVCVYMCVYVSPFVRERMLFFSADVCSRCHIDHDPNLPIHRCAHQVRIPPKGSNKDIFPYSGCFYSVQCRSEQNRERHSDVQRLITISISPPLLRDLIGATAAGDLQTTVAMER